MADGRLAQDLSTEGYDPEHCKLNLYIKRKQSIETTQISFEPI